MSRITSKGGKKVLLFNKYNDSKAKLLQEFFSVINSEVNKLIIITLNSYQNRLRTEHFGRAERVDSVWEIKRKEAKIHTRPNDVEKKRDISSPGSEKSVFYRQPRTADKFPDFLYATFIHLNKFHQRSYKFGWKEGSTRQLVLIIVKIRCIVY
ncbi:UNVERIFIED_CONTAM: hypothetical protein NCL1_42053 [Trichonephila clavipes]